MFIKLRKQLNQHQDGGNVLDSPNANASVASTTTVEPTPTPIVPTEPITPTPVEPVVIVDPNNPEPEPTPLEPVEKAWHEEAANLVGIELEEGFEIPDSVEGIATFATKVGETFAKNAVETEYQELEAKAPNGTELMKWEMQNPGRDVREYYAAKLGTPEIDPTKIDKDATDVHKDILVKDFMNKGLSASLADTMATNLIDSNASYDAVQEILKSNAERNQAQRAEREVIEQRQAQERYDAFVKDIQTRETNIRTSGKLGNVIIPATEREAYIQANYYDAGNPQFPNMSAVDIKLAQMSPEQKDLYRYLAWKDLNVGSLVIAREATKSVSEMLNKGKGGTSKMSGGTNRTSVQTANTLDSPGS